MDEADYAQEYQEKMLFAAIDAARGIPVDVEGNGYCFNCGEAVDSGRWCDKDCLHDWQIRR